MDDKPTPDANEQRPRGPLLFILICVCFFAAILIRPDLVWQLSAAVAICFGALMLLPRGEPQYSPVRGGQLSNRELTEKYFYAIMDSLQFPAYLIDRNANVRYSNDSATSVFGEIRNGEKITIRFRQPQFSKIIDDTLTKQKTVIVPYNEAVPDDLWFQVEISPIQTSDKSATSSGTLYLMAFHDQTEAKHIDRMRSDFIANASHELRTPLASLLGYIETIKGPAKDDIKARDRFLDVMLDQAQRMSRLVNDLLSLSRIEMKSHVKPSEKVEMHEVLTSVAASLDAVAGQMNVNIELDLEKNLSVTGDRDELVQVFENLIENACKYGEEGERVVVSLKKTPEDDVLVSIRDFGIGIALEHQHRITERFYRVDVARSREKQGTGLGLAIVKHILNRHSSRLNVSSTPGEGAEFSVKFKHHESQK